MRLFIAIDLAECSNHFLVLQDKIRSLGIKASYPKTFHLTLTFLGELSIEEMRVIRESLSAIRYQMFKLTFNNIGVFPEKGRIRVVWQGVQESVHLRELKKMIDKAIPQHKENKVFAPHVTLARIREIPNQDCFMWHHIEPEIHSVAVERFFLMRSALSREGPVYEKIAESRAID